LHLLALSCAVAGFCATATVNRVRAGRQQLSADSPVCRRGPGCCARQRQSCGGFTPSLACRLVMSDPVPAATRQTRRGAALLPLAVAPRRSHNGRDAESR